ncbi:hypothetical protein SAFG77S_13343 [Streptomyces afghaniensis]
MGDQTADRPVTGGDHRRHRPQHRPLLGVEVRGHGRVEPGLVAEREVDEDGHAQPFRLRHDDLRDAAGDQPVEQDDGAVGQAAQGAGEFRTGRRPRTGPVTGHGVLGDLPAEAGQVQADAPVVGVAAARRCRVVDAARQHEVHGAQGHGDDLGVLQGGMLHGNIIQPRRHGSGLPGPFDRRVGHSARS